MLSPIFSNSQTRVDSQNHVGTQNRDGFKNVITKPISLTGDRPTGALHIGHLAGSLLQRLALQDTHRSLVMIADGQALTDHMDRRSLVQDAIEEVLRDYLSIGLDPSKTTIFLQTLIPELFELTFYLSPMTTLSKLERNPTIRQEIGQKYGERRDIPVGFLTYPISQSADILAFKAEVVPVGSDQLPMIELANDLAEKFNQQVNKPVLRKAEALLSETGRLPGLDGKAKMSKSLGNVLPIGADTKTIQLAVRQMYTDPNHLKVSDPGQVEGNVVFAYLDAFHPDKVEVADLKAHYQRGGLGDMTVKKVLEKTLVELLVPFYEKRQTFSRDYLQDVLREGSQRARMEAQGTLEEVREALGVGRFAFKAL